jgi:NADH-quinone oxidoreductase subunit J
MRLTTFLAENFAILLVCTLGLVAIYALLPRPRRLPVLLGVGAGVLALVLAAFLVVRVGKLSLETFLFYLFSAVAIVAGGLLVTQQNPARAALSFAIVVLATCGLFLLQAAPFVMAATIIVYAGAIIVTFLFVIMLAQQQGLSDADARSREPLLATITGFLLLATLLYILKLSYKPDLDRWVRRSEEHLERVKEMLKREEPPDKEERDKFAAELNQFLEDYDRWWKNDTTSYPSGGQKLAAALYDARFYAFKQKASEEDPSIGLAEDLSEVEKSLTDLHKAGEEMRNNPLLGNARPASESLSEFSGPRASRRAIEEQKINAPPQLAELRRDDLGRPKLPARNTAYLGRSLFSDYLLPVELAGMLLLVATIGAIAIAQRRSPPTPSTPGSPGGLGTSSSQERTL